ncbi:hypothetical protein FXO38_03007 [Capsicum annuum]|nr:hypothetical protein FXO38_03007 [Capsicum annuum]
MLANDFDLVFSLFKRLGKGPKCPFNICTKLEKLNWEPNFWGPRDEPLIAIAHWKLTNGNLGATAMRSHRVNPLKQEQILDWNCRKKTIEDVAKGLAYLHEECRQKILHLDIKPPNILLDEKHNAKLSDFGLTKLIDWNQSQVMTMMRGTPGYLAPEWLSGVITEKVDTYNFGIVILEILSGRRHFEASETEEKRIMLNLFRKKAEEGKLVDLIDKQSEDMQFYKQEVIKTMQIVAWCLQSDYTMRPSMSMVVKTMEGVLDVEKDLDYSFNP